MAVRSFDTDTIAAISTPAGEGGIGIVRLSGSAALEIAGRLFESAGGKPVSSQKSFTARFGRAVDGSGRVLDEAILLVMRAPKSYTREDVAEISAHGGRAALEAILAAALKAGARLAEEGEFTKRAFLSGRIDLLQAEAVLDMIRAKTDVGRQWAAAQLGGSLSDKMKRMRELLIGVLSHLEAEVDFPDDSPETDTAARLTAKISEVKAQALELLESAALGFVAKRGFRAVLAGKPNAGKSSLMNRLVGSNRVIVTPYAGTTRDVVEEEIELRGFPLRLLDTAGIHESDHPIEKEGIERSRKAMASADLVLAVIDGSRPVDAADETVIRESAAKPFVLVVNKCDLPEAADAKILLRLAGKAPIVRVSSVADPGVRDLEEAIAGFVTNGRMEIPQEAVVSTLRQKDLLERMVQSLEEAEKASKNGLSAEFVALDVRLALNHLGALVGEVVTDDVLEVLFSQFCIGK
jgi:tRNA modification GTPase